MRSLYCPKLCFRTVMPSGIILILPPIEKHTTKKHFFMENLPQKRSLWLPFNKHTPKFLKATDINLKYCLVFISSTLIIVGRRCRSQAWYLDSDKLDHEARPFALFMAQVQYYFNYLY